MAKFYTLGCYTAKGLGGFVSNPSTDRKAATSALAASVGAKVTPVSYTHLTLPTTVRV